MIEESTLKLLHELVEVGREGGFQEVTSAMAIGDIALRIRAEGDRGDVAAACEATGLSRTTFWRRARLAEYRALIEKERPANLTEALRLVERADAAAKAAAEEQAGGQDEAPAKAQVGRPRKDPVVVLTTKLVATVTEIARLGLMSGAELARLVRNTYRAVRGPVAGDSADEGDNSSPETEGRIATLADLARDAGPAAREAVAEPEPKSAKPLSDGTMQLRATLVTLPPYGPGVVREVKVRRLSTQVRDGRREVIAEITNHAGHYKSRTLGWFRPGTVGQRVQPQALLVGHGLGLAEEMGRTGDGPSRDELVDRARSCGAEVLFDNLDEVDPDNSFTTGTETMTPAPEPIAPEPAPAVAATPAPSSR